MSSKTRYYAEEFLIRTAISDNSKEEFPDYKTFLESLRFNNIFQEQLLISSKTLFESLQKYFDKKSMKKKKVKQLSDSIYKYYKRSFQRSTPFGLFSETSIGHFSNEAKLAITETSQKKVFLDIEWLTLLLYKIEQEYAHVLKFKINNACYSFGSRVFQLYSVNHKDTEEINIKFSKVYSIIEQKCNDRYVSYKELVEAILYKYGPEYEIMAEKYLDGLILNHFLISDLQIDILNKFSFNDFIKIIANFDDKALYYKHLLKIERLINNYQELEIGEGCTVLSEIYTVMEMLVKAPNYLQIDLYNDSNIRLPLSVKHETESLASFLVNTGKSIQKTYLDDYKEKFLEKYGVNQEVSLIELFDSGVGLGSPYGYSHPQNDFYELPPQMMTYSDEEEQMYLREYTDALLSKQEINLDKFDSYYKNREYSKHTETQGVELFFNINKYNDTYLLSLGSIGCSNNLGGSSGRFSELSEKLETYHRKVTSIAEKDNELKGRTSCEIIFLPENLRHANVMRTSYVRQTYLPLFTDVKGTKLSLTNIYIGIDENEVFYARDTQSGNVINFYVTSMYNRTLFSNEIRFLNEISTRNDFGIFPWDIIYKKYPYVPRIVYKNIVISPANWRLSSIMLDKEVSQIIEDLSLPRKFYVEDSDNRLLIDCLNPLDIQLFSSLVKKRRTKDETMILSECISDIPVIDKDNKGRTSDIVIPFYSKPEKQNYKITRDSATKRISADIRQKLPFDEWLYLKLYIKSSRHKDFLLDYLPDILQIVKNNGGKLFFIRYEDPKPHIRLRIKSDNLFEIYSLTLERLKLCVMDKLLSSYDVSTYDREIERYGGENLINSVENLFFLDTEVILETLKILKLQKANLSSDNFALLINYIYLKAFFKGNHKEIVTFLETVCPKHIKNSNSEKQENQELIQNYIYSNNINNLLPSISKLIKAVEYFADECKDLSIQYRYTIYDSIIHVHNNRLFGIDRDKESILYDKIRGLVISELFTSEERNE